MKLLTSSDWPSQILFANILWWFTKSAIGNRTHMIIRVYTTTQPNKKAIMKHKHTHGIMKCQHTTTVHCNDFCNSCNWKHEYQCDNILELRDLLNHAFTQLPLLLREIISDLASVICGRLCFLQRTKFLTPCNPIDSDRLRAATIGTCISLSSKVED